MKLLLDENLSRRIVPVLQTAFPGTTQVSLVGLEGATDAELCDYAAHHDFVVYSKDRDFRRLVEARGYRSRVVLLLVGNVPNDEAASILVRGAARIEGAFADPRVAVVVVPQE